VQAQRFRQAVQGAIVLILLYEGWRFSRFVAHFREGAPYVPRPPAVEAFLPISALMGLRSWIGTGVFDRVHPAGLAILLAALLTALVLHRGFCGWLCPVGTISEYLGRLGIRVVGRKLTPPKVLDYPLRLLKFLLLAFFLKVIFLDMPAEAASAFINAPYNKVADVKMLDFWLSPGGLTLQVTGFLVLLSLLVQNAWCRYLCPYGALLIIVGLLSPFKIKRDQESCIDCGKCNRVCPSYIDIQGKEKVTSTECIKCFRCVTGCPVPGTLYMEPLGKRAFSAVDYGILLLVLFFSVLFVAKLTGHWTSAVDYREYQDLIPRAWMFTH
jgi:polyferredoxin